jgi:hypothetical protein
MWLCELMFEGELGLIRQTSKSSWHNIMRRTPMLAQSPLRLPSLPCETACGAESFTLSGFLEPRGGLKFGQQWTSTDMMAV